MGKKLFAFSQVWYGLGVWTTFFFLYIFFAEYKIHFLVNSN